MKNNKTNFDYFITFIMSLMHLERNSIIMIMNGMDSDLIRQMAQKNKVLNFIWKIY